MTVTDERVDLGVDLDKTVPCEADECSAVATWVKRHIPCKHGVFTCCEPHRQAIQQFFDSPGVNACTICDADIERLDWELL
jgi:hypothetical protein